MLLLLTLAIVPGIAISLFFYYRKKRHRPPPIEMVISFVLGMISTLPALLLQSLAEDVRDYPDHHSIWSFVWYAFVVVACSEEGAKFFFLRLYSWPKRSFITPLDGIIYAVMIAMGFATVENLEYAIQFGVSAGFSRFFLAVPAHGAFAVLMGYNAGLAKAKGRGHTWLLVRGLLIAIVFHGSFDFFVFLQQSQYGTHEFSTGVLSFGAFATFYIAVRLALRSIRMQSMLEDEEPEDEAAEKNIDPTEQGGNINN